MSRIFRKNHVFNKSKFVSIPEEVGMDIVEAMDVLESNVKTLKIKKLKKIEKLELETRQSEKRKEKEAETEKNEEKFEKLVKSTADKAVIKQVQTLVVTNQNEQLSTYLLKKINKEFVKELKNEIENAPNPSSKSLSAWFRSSTPSRSKNHLFKETVTIGHLKGQAEKCVVTLTPQVLTMTSRSFRQGFLHIIIDCILLIQLDEFHSVCTFYSSDCEKPITIENFPPGRLHKFLLVLNYLTHISSSYRKLIHHYSWNFVFGRHKKPSILSVFPVTLAFEHQAKMKNFSLCQEVLYKIEDLVDEDNEAVELFETESNWTSAFIVLK